jgi:sulfoxide reductase heme-binding subunit YedZ
VGGGVSDLLWEVCRSTGLISLLLLTVAVVLGATAAWGSPAARAARQGVHRWAAGLSVGLLVAHVVTAVADSYVELSVRDAFVPFTAGYRPLEVGLGTVASDLLLAVLLTSLARARLRGPGWRRVHVLAYAAWPLAVLHAYGAGSDVEATAVRAVTAGCGTAVVLVLLARLWRGGSR